MRFSMYKNLSTLFLSLALCSSLSACSQLTGEYDYENMSAEEIADLYCEEALICDGMPSTTTDAELNACSTKFANSLNSLSGCKTDIAMTMDCILDINDACFSEFHSGNADMWCSDEINSMKKCIKNKYPQLDNSKILNSLFGNSLGAGSLSIETIADKYCSNKNSCDASVDKAACVTKATTVYTQYKQCRTETAEYLHCLNSKFLTCTTSTSNSCVLEQFSLESCFKWDYEGVDEFPFDDFDDDL